MASLRDAHKRLEIIYKTCAPEAIEQNAAEANLDEFTRLKKKIHADVKQIREALRDRDLANRGGGTTTESAETSYRIRVMIKSTKESHARLTEIYEKEAKKKKQKEPEKVAQHKEIVELCKQHIEEVENLEKRKLNDAHVSERVDLLQTNGGGGAHVKGKIKSAYLEGLSTVPDDAYGSDLPDIDAEEDLKAIRNKDKEIDNDVQELGVGVARLKDIAIDMGQELDRQNEDLDRIDKKVDKALDHVDNINVTLKKSIDGVYNSIFNNQVMKGDKFMVNCILLCIVLALAAFISTQFLNAS
ncbi:hypothetical protein HDV02_002689 [Globomyces sp. JEL0801]|nr:hypothetical protein HDV02_002689 [Globomyces sp. JEL0801]